MSKNLELQNFSPIFAKQIKVKMLGRSKNNVPVRGNMASIIRRDAQRVIISRQQSNDVASSSAPVSTEYHVILDLK